MTDEAQEIILKAFTIESTTIIEVLQEWERVKAADEISDTYDAYLSDMDGETIVVEPDGTVINPYSDEFDLLALLSPLLELLSVDEIEAYLYSRHVLDMESEPHGKHERHEQTEAGA